MTKQKKKNKPNSIFSDPKLGTSLSMLAITGGIMGILLEKMTKMFDGNEDQMEKVVAAAINAIMARHECTLEDSFEQKQEIQKLKDSLDKERDIHVEDIEKLEIQMTELKCIVDEYKKKQKGNSKKK